MSKFDLTRIRQEPIKTDCYDNKTNTINPFLVEAVLDSFEDALPMELDTKILNEIIDNTKKIMEIEDVDSIGNKCFEAIMTAARQEFGDIILEKRIEYLKSSNKIKLNTISAEEINALKPGTEVFDRITDQNLRRRVECNSRELNKSDNPYVRITNNSGEPILYKRNPSNGLLEINPEGSRIVGVINGSIQLENPKDAIWRSGATSPVNY